jgi:hypothetical protein
MPQRIRAMLFALPLIGAAAAANLQAQAAGNPACKLLTAADLRRATGQAYGDPTRRRIVLLG